MQVLCFCFVCSYVHANAANVWTKEEENKADEVCTEIKEAVIMSSFRCSKLSLIELVFTRAPFYQFSSGIILQKRNVGEGIYEWINYIYIAR